MSHEDILKGLFDETLVGNAPAVLDLTNQGLAEGMTPSSILFDALIPALEEVGARFERGDFFVPEMLISGKAMSGALNVLRPLLASTGAETVGTFLMGTVKGDVHDIGKNLVNIMLEGAGFEVIDIGVQCAPEKFIAAINEHKPDIVGVAFGRWLIPDNPEELRKPPADVFAPLPTQAPGAAPAEAAMLYFAEDAAGESPLLSGCRAALRQATGQASVDGYEQDLAARLGVPTLRDYLSRPGGLS